MKKSGNSLPLDPSTIIRQAVFRFQQGHTEDAEVMARKVLESLPEQDGAHYLLSLIASRRGEHKLAGEHLTRAVQSNSGEPLYHFHLGIALHMQGELEGAVESYQRAVQIKPDYADAYNNSSNALRYLGRLPEALLACERTIQLQPQSAAAHFNHGNVLGDLARKEEALAAYRQAIRLNPGYVEAYYQQGNLFRTLGRLEDAMDSYQKAIKLKPEYVEAHNNLGLVLSHLGRLDEALSIYQRVLELNPNLAIAHNNVGKALFDLGRPKASLKACDRAVELSPDFPGAHNNRGNALVNLGRPYDALEAYERAIALDPEFANAHNNRGTALFNQGRLVEALAAYEWAVKLNPEHVNAHNNLGNVLGHLARLDEAEASYRRALELKPHYTAAHSNLLFMLAGRALLSPGQMLQEMREWDRVQGEVGRSNPMPERLSEDLSGRRLRVGYVSPDFRMHAVSFFFEPLLAAHDRSRFDIFCYDANVREKDAMTRRLRNLAGHWREVAGKTDMELARLVYDDQIDILVDLAGHTSGNSLGAFTYRPAPVQVTYLGFFAATGLEALDYWITDDVLHPGDTIEKTVETIYRLPRPSHCYLPPAEAPPVAPCPNGDEHVVFGSFSNLSKLTPEVIETWSQLLNELPGSRLLLTTRHLGDPLTRQLLVDRFSEHDVPVERLLMRHSKQAVEWLATYAEVDIVLDPFPRTGTTTTAEALWMGLPVITLAGQRYVDRASTTLLAAIGLDELVTYSHEEYLAKALELAHDPETRAEFRGTLRERMAQSPLRDDKGLARAMEAAYGDMWERLCCQA